MKTLTDYQAQKVNHFKSKLAYHRAKIDYALERGREEQVEYQQQKIDYVMERLAYFGYSEEQEIAEV